MQSAQGSYSPAELDACSQKRSTSSPNPNPDARREINSWERTGLVAGTALSLAAGVSLPLAGQASAYSAPVETSSPSASLASRGAMAQTSASASAVSPDISPESTTETKFGAGYAISQAPDSEVSELTSACQQNPTCKGIAFIDAKLPELQQRVQELRAQMQQFQGKNTAQNLETHRAILANRAVEIARQKAEIGKQISDTELQLLETQTLLAMQPYEANFAESLLAQDARYQDHLQQLQEIDRQIAEEFSQPELNQEQLKVLYAQYNQFAEQLYQDAQDILTRFIAISRTQASNPLWQEPMYYELLQQLMTQTHQYEVLAQRSDTISYIETRLQERRAELANHLRQYASLQQQLETQTQILQDYIVRRQALQDELTQPKFAPPPPPAAEPELATVPLTKLWQLFDRVPREMQREVALALLMGAGILTALARHQSYQLSPKDYQLPLPQTELVAADAQLLQTEPQSLASIFDTYSEKDFEVFSAMAIAIVLQTFQPAEVEPPALPVQLLSELNGFAIEPVTLPLDDIDIFADEAIEIALNGLEFEAKIDEMSVEDFRPEHFLQFFEAEMGELVAA